MVERQQRLSRRGEALSALFDGIPEHLVHALGDWLRYDLTSLYGTSAVDIALSLELDRTVGPRVVTASDRLLSEFTAAVRDEELCLDIIDMTLRNNEIRDTYGAASGNLHGQASAQTLDRLLTLGGSAWKVAAADGQYRLERRVDETAANAEAAAEAAAIASGRPDAAIHLRQAWVSVYGRQPDPRSAVTAAILAVEDVAIPVVCNGQQVTLSAVYRELEDHPEKWRLVIVDRDGNDDVGPVAAMVRLLWKSDSSRHAGSTRNRPVESESAQAAVHLAATLVQWFASGAVVAR